MDSIAHSQRQLPHTSETRLYAVKLYRSGHSVRFVCRRYHISKASLMRWNKRFDGTRESLQDRSHRPLTPHPNRHTAKELKWISDLHRRTPHISVCEPVRKASLSKGIFRTSGVSVQGLQGSGIYVKGSFQKGETQTAEIRHAGEAGC